MPLQTIAIAELNGQGQGHSSLKLMREIALSPIISTHQTCIADLTA